MNLEIHDWNSSTRYSELMVVFASDDIAYEAVDVIETMYFDNQDVKITKCNINLNPLDSVGWRVLKRSKNKLVDSLNKQ